jgi:SAM-dependent methyltransferase
MSRRRHAAIGEGLNPTTLQHRGEQLAAKNFLGGPVETFEAIGRLQLITLLRCGIYPDSRVLDLGCGSLRGGYWLINFLRPDRYFGIEPNTRMLEIGKEEILGAELIAEKRPRFLTNDRFDHTEFETQFDFFLARSVWTHASREQIRTMLNAFAAHGAEDAVFLTSYLPTGPGEKGYTDDAWVGRSHETDSRGVVLHDFAWIEQECQQRDFEVRELPVDRKRQVWPLISRGGRMIPSDTFLADLVSVDAKNTGSLKRVKGAMKRMFNRLAGP